MLFSCLLLLLQSSLAVDIDGAIFKGDELSGQGIRVYRGIKYASAERWRAPVPYQYAKGIYEMHEHGDQCPQMSNNRGKWQVTMIENKDVPQSEDCLNLVVYQPKKSEGPLPVLIYLHGGNFVTGSNAMAMQDFSRLAQTQGVLVVVPNYRVGALGFTMDMTLPVDQPNGNWGMMDVEMAAEWVKSNIGAFGGDPHNVTLMGHSAGAMIAHLLTANRHAVPWHRLLLGSGTISTKPRKGREEAIDEVKQIGRLLEVKQENLMEGLRDLDAVKLSKSLYEKGGRLVYTPIIDGVFLTDKTLPLTLPTLFTWTRDDGSFFVPADILMDQTNASYLQILYGMFPKVATKLKDLYPFQEKASYTLSVMLTDMIFRKPALYWARQATQATVYEFTEGLTDYLREPLEGIGQGGVFHNNDIPLLNGVYDRFDDGKGAKEASEQWMAKLGDYVKTGESFGVKVADGDAKEEFWMQNPWPVDIQLARLRYPKSQ